MARGVTVEDRMAGAYENVRDRFTANRRGLTPPAGSAPRSISREDATASSRVMQNLDNHDLSSFV